MCAQIEMKKRTNKKETKADRVFLRMSERERLEAGKEAAKKGLTLSAYIRMLLYDRIPALRG